LTQCGHGVANKESLEQNTGGKAMQINDGWMVHDVVTGLAFEIKCGKKLDCLHVESVTGGTAADDHPKINRDFYFTKDGAFDGTGQSKYGVCPDMSMVARRGA